MSNVNMDSGWQKNGETYIQAGTGPTLNLIVDIGAGNLTLSR
jgi:hypothetical protein